MLPCSCQEQLSLLAVPPVICRVYHCNTDPWLGPRRREKLCVMLLLSNTRSEYLHAKSKDSTLQKDTAYLYNCLVFPKTLPFCLFCFGNLPTAVPLQSAEAASSKASSSTNTTQRALSFRCVLYSLQSPASYFPITPLFWISLSHWSIWLWLLSLLVFKHKSEHWSKVH